MCRIQTSENENETKPWPEIRRISICRKVTRTDKVLANMPDSRKCGVGTAVAQRPNRLCQPTELVVVQARLPGGKGLKIGLEHACHMLHGFAPALSALRV